VANHKSAIKRIKQNAKRRLRNKSARSALRTQVNKATEALTGDVAAAVVAFREAESLLNKTASKGIIPKKRAARKTSRLAKRLHALQTAQA
jgi:small subunit ribosomal protein S20